MSKPTNTSLIGVFILGAVALLVGSIITFSSFSFNKKTYMFVTYITDSLNGLSVNSDVKFHGVKIGSVKEIKFNLIAQATDDVAIPVVFEIDSKFVEASFSTGTKDMEENMAKALRQGLRTRIQQSSIVTGLLYIDIDFFQSAAPPIFRDNEQTGLLEIPSIPSNLAQMVNSVATILNNLAGIDFKKITAQLQETARKLDEGVSTIEFKRINDNIVGATESANKIFSDRELSATIKNIGELVENVDVLSHKLSGNVDDLSLEFKTTASSLRTTLSEIGKAAELVRGAAQSRQGTIGQSLSDALEQINDAARAVRALAEYIQRNPNALVTGKEDAQK